MSLSVAFGAVTWFSIVSYFLLAVPVLLSASGDGGRGGRRALAARPITRRHPRLAGLCLVASSVIPTWYAAVVNLIPIVAGLILLTARTTPEIQVPIESNRSGPVT